MAEGTKEVFICTKKVNLQPRKETEGFEPPPSTNFHHYQQREHNSSSIAEDTMEAFTYKKEVN